MYARKWVYGCCIGVIIVMLAGLWDVYHNDRKNEDERISAFRAIKNSTTYSPLEKAQHEEVLRRTLAIESLEQLSMRVVASYKNYVQSGGDFDTLRDKMVAAFTEDKNNVALIAQSIAQNDVGITFPLRAYVGGTFDIYHRIFDDALTMLMRDISYYKKILTKHVGSYLDLQKDEQTFFPMNDEEWASRRTDMGTVFPNYIQVILLRTLSILEQKSFQDIVASMPIVGGVHLYDVSHSPVMQTTPLPSDITLPDAIISWFYYYKDKHSPVQGELLLSTFSGYTFGGSRQHARYKTKILKNQDCSSIVADHARAWTPFATYHILAIGRDVKDYSPEDKRDIRSAAQVLTRHPRGAEVGDIFVSDNTSRHVGYVVEVYKNGDDIVGFKSLSMSCKRSSTPYVEGLGYHNYTIVQAVREEDGTMTYISDGDAKIYFYHIKNRPTLWQWLLGG